MSLDAPDFYTRQAKKLSGGMRRRLSIAVSGLNDPRTLFMDEPTTGLDPEMKRDVWHVIEKLKRAQKCIILTTHGMDEADALCDRIGIMANGQLRCVAPVGQLRARFGRVIQLTFMAQLSKSQKSSPAHVQAYDTRLDKFLKSFH